MFGSTLPAILFPVLRFVSLSTKKFYLTSILAGINVTIYLAVYKINTSYISNYIYCADDIADQTETIKRIAMDKYQKISFKGFRKVASILAFPIIMVFLNEALKGPIAKIFTIYYPFEDVRKSGSISRFIQNTGQAVGFLSVHFPSFRNKSHTPYKIGFNFALCLVFAALNLANWQFLEKQALVWPPGLLLFSIILGNTHASIYNEGTLIGDEKTKKIAGVLIYMAHSFGFLYSRLLTEFAFW